MQMRAPAAGVCDSPRLGVLIGWAAPRAICRFRAIEVPIVKLPTFPTSGLRADRAVAPQDSVSGGAGVSPIAALAHDLRSPLAAVLGFARLAREELEQGEARHALQLIERIERSASTLEAILRSTLEAEACSPASSPTAVLEQIHAERKRELERRGIRLVVPADVAVVAVRHADLYRLISNLVGNAIDHMGDARDGVISVSMTCHGATATLRVRDNGVGIPADQRERVFDAEHSLRRDGRGRPRRGLGLAIVRQLAASWGGCAWVEPTPPPGATLCVTLPVAG